MPNGIWMLGRLVKDPELKYTANGDAVCNFSVADDVGKDKTVFYDCIAWKETGERINEWMKKGDKIFCAGRVNQENWEKDGQKRSRKTVTVFQFNNLMPKQGAGSDAPDEDIPF